MPIIQVNVAASPSGPLCHQLTETLLRHTTETLHKRRDLGALLGDVHEESYIHVHDVRAAA